MKLNKVRWIPLLFCIAPTYASLPAENHIPGVPSQVVGAYSATFAPEPLGIGFGFTAGFRLQDGNESEPVAFWISKDKDVLLAVDSISSINRVFSETLKSRPKWPDAKAIHVARLLISEKVRYQGVTGIALTMDRSDLLEVTRRLSDAGLDDNAVKLIRVLGSSMKEGVDSVSKTWSSEWYEIDSMGGVEKVTVKGSLDPVKVISILHETVYGEGTVKPGLLRRDNFVDVNLDR